MEKDSTNDSAKMKGESVWILIEEEEQAEGYAWVFTNERDAYLRMCELIISHAKYTNDDGDSIFRRLFVGNNVATLCDLDKNGEPIKGTIVSFQIYDDKIQ